MHLSPPPPLPPPPPPPPPQVALTAVYSKGKVLLLLTFPIVGVCNCSTFCCTLLYVHSSFAIILMGKRELVVVLSMSSWCLVMVKWLFLAVPWVCMRFVIVVFPDHTHLLCLILTCCNSNHSSNHFNLPPTFK